MIVSFLADLRKAANPVCLRSWANRRGLTVSWAPGDSWVTITGGVAAVDRGFHVSITVGAGPQPSWSANRAAKAPVACGEVSGIGDIHSFVRPTMLDDVLTTATSPGYTPQQMVTAYDAAPLLARGFTGQNETVVFFEVDGYTPSDVQAFAHATDKPLNLQAPLGNLGKAEGESTMDIETVHEIAPSARLIDLSLLAKRFATMSTAAAYESAFALAAHNWPGAIWSISLGSCEDSPQDFNSSDLHAVNAAVAAAERTGTTVFASSGDTGGLDCTPPNDAGLPPLASWEGVSVPAALPNVTGVGGTTLFMTSSGGYIGETTWTEPLLLQGSGGGVSKVFPRPSWQDAPGTGGYYDTSDMRQVPDVSADANPASGNNIIEGGNVTTGGGTSLASPLWAGFTALIDQYLRSRGGHELGFLNPTLYRLASSRVPFPPLHSVVTGGNDFYFATPGYNMVTGLGSPDVWNLARDLASEGK